ALAHAVECFTMSYHQPFTDAVALLAMEYVARYLRVAFSQANNLEARYHMSAAAMLAGLSYGTDSAGAAHAMSQTAGGVHDAPHGALTGRLLAPVMEYNYAGEPQRFARIAQALGLEIANKSVYKAAEVGVEYVYQLTEDLDIPSAEQVQQIDDHAMLILQEIGVDFLHPRALDAFRRAGLKIEENRVRFERGFIEEQIRNVPASFQVQARNPKNSVVIGGNHMVNAPVYGPPFITDLDRGRRGATIEDFTNFDKMAQATPQIHCA